MFNEQIDGVAINAGHGPCSTAAINCSEPSNQTAYSTTGIEGKPVFLYTGVNDSVVAYTQSNETANFFESHGAKVKRSWIHDFIHVWPNSVQSND